MLIWRGILEYFWICKNRFLNSERYAYLKNEIFNHQPETLFAARLFEIKLEVPSKREEIVWEFQMAPQIFVWLWSSLIVWRVSCISFTRSSKRPYLWYSFFSVSIGRMAFVSTSKFQPVVEISKKSLVVTFKITLICYM